MKYPTIRYYAETDSLAINLAPGTGNGASEIGEGIIATFDKDGRILALELFNNVARDYPELVTAAQKNAIRRSRGALTGS